MGSRLGDLCDPAGDRGEAYDAERSERRLGEPANEVREVRDAGRMGRRPGRGAVRRPVDAVDAAKGTFRAESLEGLASREAENAPLSPTSIQFSLISNAAPFSRWIRFAARVDIGEV